MRSVEPDSAFEDRRWLLVVGALLLLGTALGLGRELSPPWAAAQEQARAQVRERLGAQRAQRLPHGFRQTWIEGLGRVDRCVLCHIGMEEGPEFAALPHPARSHPHPSLMASHPVERFGCTLCHGGQGPATDQRSAHGESAHWEEPLLSQARASAYGLTRAELMEARCNACHAEEEQVAGMPFLNRAKALFRERRCTACHSVRGAGGTDGPDLGEVGDHPPEHLRFPEGWTGPRTALAWHAAHIRAPAALVPGSTMRQYKLDERDALALALLVTSWKRWTPPTGWRPRPVPDQGRVGR